MKSRFCESFGVEVPIVLAPMASMVTPQLVAAVSNAGGLGLVPLWHVDIDTLRRTIREIKELTDRPFGVNLNMDFPSMERLDACLEEGVSIISLFWRLNEDFVRHAKSAGAKVIHTVGNSADAKAVADLGVDAICAQGLEAGGHVRGKVGTMALIPSVVDAVGDVPVIAAGGIADGRGMAAAFALGASAVWVGTRFLGAEEASIHPEYQKRLIAASENDTAYFENLFDIGWLSAPHRVLRNSTVEMWEAAGRPPSGQRPDEGGVIGHSDLKGDIVRYQSSSPGPEMKGDIEAMSLWAGQGVSCLRKAQPASQIVDEISREARDILSRF